MIARVYIGSGGWRSRAPCLSARTVFKAAPVRLSGSPSSTRVRWTAWRPRVPVTCRAASRLAVSAGLEPATACAAPRFQRGPSPSRILTKSGECRSRTYSGFHPTCFRDRRRHRAAILHACPHGESNSGLLVENQVSSPLDDEGRCPVSRPGQRRDAGVTSPNVRWPPLIRCSRLSTPTPVVTGAGASPVASACRASSRGA